MGLAQAQLRLDLRSPADHYDLLHVEQRKTVVAFTPQQARQWHTLNAEVARDRLAAWVDQPDVYVTPNEFYHWRRIANTAAFNALYIDLDAHNGQDILALVEGALGALVRAKIPEPNTIVYTGRGAHFYWLIKRTPAMALPRWQACQRELVRITNADRMSADATRVLRVIGSVNGRNGQKVRAELLTPAHYEFDWLAEQILPFTRAEVRDIRAVRANAKKPRPHAGQGTIYDVWYLRYQDLHKIVDYHWFGGVAEGNRDRILFHMANALSWFTVSEALESEIVALARQITPTLTEQEARGYCSSVIRRARDTQRHGHEERYAYKRSTLYERLADLIPDELAVQLRAIIPESLHIERRRESWRKADEKRRRDAGSVGRDEYLSQADERRQQAISLRQQGKTVRAIAAELGISVGAVSGYLKPRS